MNSIKSSQLDRFRRGLSQTREVIASLPPSSQRKLWLLLLMMVLRAVIELAGLALAYPVFVLFARPEVFWESVPGRSLMAATGATDPSKALVLLVLIFALLFGASALASALMMIQQYRFIGMLQTEVSGRLLAAYLAKPYEFFLQRNVSELTKNITVSVSEFAMGFMLHGLVFVSAAIILVAMVGTLLVFNPVVTLSASGLVAAMYVAVFLLVRGRVRRWGGERERRVSGMFKCVEEALNGIREVKASGSEQLFEQRFRAQAAHYAEMNARFQAVHAVPGQIAQGTVIVVVAGLLLVLGAQGIRPEGVIPTLGVFYVAVLRLLPLGNQLYSGWTTASYYWPTIGIVHTGLVESGDLTDAGKVACGTKVRPVVEVGPFMRTVKFADVYYRYPTGSSDTLRAFSWEVRFGEHVALIGPSGAGKSTILDLLLGLIRPGRGAILIDGVPLTDEAVAAWRRQVAYVPQQPFFLDSGIAENVAFGLEESEIDWQRVEEAVAGAGLAGVLKRLPQGLRTPIGDRGVRLSGGERQRVAIARALYRRPRLLVLDEATSALDAETERRVLAELADLKGRVTTVIATHRTEVLRYCDAVFQVESGQLVKIRPALVADGPSTELG